MKCIHCRGTLRKKVWEWGNKHFTLDIYYCETCHLDVIPKRAERELAKQMDEAYGPLNKGIAEGSAMSVRNKVGKSLIILFIILFLSHAQVVAASAVYLKDGTVLSGEILTRNNDKLKFRTEYGVLEIDNSKIDTIKYGNHIDNSVPERKTIAVTVEKEQAPERYKVETIKDDHPEIKEVKPDKWFWLETGYNLKYFHYQEPGLMKITGVLHGIEMNFILRKNNWYYKSMSSLAANNLTYDGGLQDGTPLTTTTDDYILTEEVTAGYDFVSSRRAVLFRPLLGLGWRYWNDYLNGEGGYEREIAYLYSPVGFEVIGTLPHGWQLGFRSVSNLLWKGGVISHLDPDDIFNIANYQNMGKGLCASITIKKMVSENRFFLCFTPYLNYWKVQRSDNSYFVDDNGNFGAIFEPANETSEYGMKLSMEF